MTDELSDKIGDLLSRDDIDTRLLAEEIGKAIVKILVDAGLLGRG